MLPTGFVYLKDPRMIFAMVYAGDQNFMGRVVKGYQAKVCILTEPAAEALQSVQDKLDRERPGVQLKIFDAYRPLQACQDFKEWAQSSDEKMKAHHYPNLSRLDLFKQGYISDRSQHCRGSTVDLTLALAGRELEMGTPFDYFGPRSHTLNPDISKKARENRQFLKALMENAGFENYQYEWWHYTLKREPFTDTYFDFPIK